MKIVLVKNAMMLWVGSKNWSCPKNVLVETDSKHGELLADIAFAVFEKYKKEQEEEVYLVSYMYYGDVEVMEGLT